MTPSRVKPLGQRFVDEDGGEVILRGVNLGGDSKVPYPDGGTHFPGDFADHRSISFIGRPFPIDQADEHFERIAHWGFNTLRLLTTWEAVEHAGPGQYDEAYLDHFAAIAERAGHHGLRLFVDFHQDVWSRMTGGDGAPGWTFEAVGLDFTKFDAADAAHVMQARYDYASSEPRQAAYPQMSWGSNYRLPANGIMWTLFWGGRLFTPEFLVDGRNVQDFLQGHYLGAMGEVARRLKDMPHVLGFDSLNEPGLGWMGEELSYRHLAASTAHPERPRVGPALSPLDALAMARGCCIDVPVLKRDAAGNAVPTETRRFNPDGVSIWLDGRGCPFEAAGAYRFDRGAAIALDEQFFQRRGGHSLAMPSDGFGPFYHRVAEAIRSHQPDWSLFVEMDAFAHVAGRRFPSDLPDRCVNACHWYDVGMLYLKRFHPDDHRDVIANVAERGLDQIGERYRRQLADLHSEAATFPGGAPTLIGEFGIPYDLDEGTDYDRWAAGVRDGLWQQHEQALGLMYDAIDDLKLHSAQWNYTASNRNDARVGDGWNQEDLSIYSIDQREAGAGIGSGGRAIAGFCRPFVRRAQGRIDAMRFDSSTGMFRASLTLDHHIAGGTEVYVPLVQYPSGAIVRVEGVPALLDIDLERQRLHVRALTSGSATIMLERAG